MAKTFILHDESLNEHGFWMLTAGADLKQFKKNPIMLFNHNRPWRDTEDTMLPIGHWDNIRLEGDQILADAVFDADEFAQKIAAKVESGTLRMASAGARPITTSSDAKYIKPGQRYETVLKWNMKEASIVDIGANNNAMALYDDKDNLITLADGPDNIPLPLITQTSIDTNMKELSKLLKLADGAGEQDFITAVQPVLNENVSLRAEVQKERDEKKVLQDRLDAIELKDKEARTTEATTLVDAALKDGRLEETKEQTVKAFWLKCFEADHEGAKAALAALPVKSKTAVELSDNTGGSAWDKRQQEIEANAKK
jgi:hypothetical protein